MSVTVPRDMPMDEVVVAVVAIQRMWSNITGYWHEVVDVVRTDEYVAWELKPTLNWPEKMPYPAPE